MSTLKKMIVSFFGLLNQIHFLFPPKIIISNATAANGRISYQIQTVPVSWKQLVFDYSTFG